jgi:hypothetical protein
MMLGYLTPGVSPEKLDKMIRKNSVLSQEQLIRAQQDQTFAVTIIIWDENEN